MAKRLTLALCRAALPARTKSTVAMIAVIALCATFTLNGCAQSVYSWHVEEDVVFDSNLTGSWIGEGDAEGCLLKIAGDPSHIARHYNFEISKLKEGCADLKPESGKWSGGGQLVQIGQQRFAELWGNECDLYTLLKLNTDSQTLSFAPINADYLTELIQTKQAKLEGRIQGHTMWPDDVLLTSPTEDLRQFLGAHAEDKKLFSEEEAVKFHRK